MLQRPLRVAALACALLTTLVPATAASAPLGGAAPHLGAAAPSAGELRLGLERLATVGSVLYVAAHPDDENTRLIAWLAGERRLRTAYVSLTRGGGGQNLIGPELGPLLGLIRTHELLAARALDRGEQYFSRAIDFGFSKSAEETLRVWGHEAALADLVRVYRTFRPDIVITRFSPAPPNHGHHTASAILAREAFDAAADPARFPEQLGALRPHQPARLLENKSHWRLREDEDLTRFQRLDVGTFNPLIGLSWGEIAAASRTMHKSQGFGAAPQFGPILEYFEPVAGAPAEGADPLDGLDFTWARFLGTEALRAALDDALRAFDPAEPARVLPALARVHAALLALPEDNPFKAVKLAEAEALLQGAAALVLDARAPGAVTVPGGPLTVTAQALARASDAVTLRAVRWPDGQRTPIAQPLAAHTPWELERPLTTPPGAAWSTPAWLREPPDGGVHRVPSPALTILPDGPADLALTFELDIAGARLEVERPLRYAWVDPVEGERARPVEILPPVTVTPTAPVVMHPNGEPRVVTLRVEAHGAARRGEARLEAPASWRVAPARAAFAIREAGGAAELTFTVTPPPEASAAATLRAFARSEGVEVSVRRDAIDYVHVPQRTVLRAATIRAVPVALRAGGRRIAYLPGAADEVPQSLRQVGYDVTVLDERALAEADLTTFDAVIAGIRAFNVHPWLRHHHDRLMDYVAQGGRYLVQYVVSNRFRPLVDTPIGPWPFTIERVRITDPAAELRFFDPQHPALTTPNRLGPADFDGWVQERGLYFATEWDPRYQLLFEAHDPGEEALPGGALIARHGAGVFVYTGLAFFRQLPEGVPGAYRLLANLLALPGGAP